MLFQKGGQHIISSRAKFANSLQNYAFFFFFFFTQTFKIVVLWTSSFWSVFNVASLELPKLWKLLHFGQLLFMFYFTRISKFVVLWTSIFFLFSVLLYSNFQNFCTFDVNILNFTRISKIVALWTSIFYLFSVLLHSNFQDCRT